MTINELLDKFEGDYMIIRNSIETRGGMKIGVKTIVYNTYGHVQLSFNESLRWNDWDKEIDRYYIKNNQLVIEYNA